MSEELTVHEAVKLLSNRTVREKRDLSLADKTVPKLMDLLMIEKKLSNNRLVMGRLADKGAKVMASVAAIEEELKKRGKTMQEITKGTTAKGGIVSQQESQLEMASIAFAKIQKPPLDSDDSDPEEEERVKKMYCNFKARYDEALLPLPSLYKQVKALTMEESQKLDFKRLARLQLEEKNRKESFLDNKTLLEQDRQLEWGRYVPYPKEPIVVTPPEDHPTEITLLSTIFGQVNLGYNGNEI